jgi:hypothetical protein
MTIAKSIRLTLTAREARLIYHYRAAPYRARLSIEALARMLPREENDRLYQAARDACHSVGLPWTDPRDGMTHQPTRRRNKVQR